MVEEILKRVLPKRLEWKWLTWAKVDERGNIIFKGLALLSKGFWERLEREPFFYDELRKGIMRELFENDPNFDIHVCGSGMICKIDEEGRGTFELEVWDSKKDRVVFRGVAQGKCLMGPTGMGAHATCIINTVTLKPVEEE